MVIKWLDENPIAIQEEEMEMKGLSFVGSMARLLQKLDAGEISSYAMAVIDMPLPDVPPKMYSHMRKGFCMLLGGLPISPEGETETYVFPDNSMVEIGPIKTEITSEGGGGDAYKQAMAINKIQ